jgi:uncharacterized protein
MVDYAKLRQLGTISKFEEGDFIFHEGDPGEEMFIVLSGGVNVYLGSFDDLPINASTIGPGNFFGEMSLLENQPRSASVIAASETTVLRLNKQNFLTVLTEQPELSFNIMTVLSGRIRFQNNELRNREKTIRTLRLELSQKAASPLDTKKGLEMAAAVQNQLESHDEIYFPPQHKKYGVIAPAIHRNYILTKVVKCPVCHNEFTTKMVRLSVIKIEKVESDFRKRYCDFEPLWYSIWVCANCYYTNHHLEFERIEAGEANALKTKIAPLKNKLIFQFTDPREINQVFIAYYLALHIEKLNKNSPFKLGKLWLYLSWLYQDVHDPEMAKIASALALKYYSEGVNHNTFEISIEQEQQCCLILGELFLAQDDEAEALKCFQAAYKEYGKEAFNHQAIKRINSLKKI